MVMPGTTGGGCDNFLPQLQTFFTEVQELAAVALFTLDEGNFGAQSFYGELLYGYFGIGIVGGIKAATPYTPTDVDSYTFIQSWCSLFLHICSTHY